MRKSSRIKAICNKEPSKGINEILFKWHKFTLTLWEQKRLISLKCRNKARQQNPFILDEAREDNKYYDDYYNQRFYSSESHSDSDATFKWNCIVSSDSDERISLTPDGSLNMSRITYVEEGIVHDLDSNELVDLDNRNVSDEILPHKWYENSMNNRWRWLKLAQKWLKTPKISQVSRLHWYG